MTGKFEKPVMRMKAADRCKPQGIKESSVPAVLVCVLLK